jgi:hypothetical protein
MTSTEKPAGCRAAEGIPSTPATLRQAYRTIISYRNTVDLKNNPLPLPNAPCSLAPSCRIGWTRTMRPSMLSWTESATTQTWGAAG